VCSDLFFCEGNIFFEEVYPTGLPNCLGCHANFSNAELSRKNCVAVRYRLSVLSLINREISTQTHSALQVQEQLVCGKQVPDSECPSPLSHTLTHARTHILPYRYKSSWSVAAGTRCQTLSLSLSHTHTALQVQEQLVCGRGSQPPGHGQRAQAAEAHGWWSQRAAEEGHAPATGGVPVA
jgi:hypothetical protein